MAGNPKNEIVVISDSDSESEYGEEQQEEDQQDDEEQQGKERLAAERRKIFDPLQARLRKLSEEEQEEAKLMKLPKTPKKTDAGPSVLPTPPDSMQKLKVPSSKTMIPCLKRLKEFKMKQHRLLGLATSASHASSEMQIKLGKSGDPKSSWMTQTSLSAMGITCFV
jgi:hypothetical protein